MATPTHIHDGMGTGSVVRVTEFGELVTGSPEYDSVSSLEMGVVDTAYNLVTARGDAYTVITGMTLTANRNVGVNDARIVVYANEVSATSRTRTKVLFTTDLASKTSLALLPLRLLVAPGFWVSAETNDDDVFITLMYYHINKRQVDQSREGFSP